MERVGGSVEKPKEDKDKIQKDRHCEAVSAVAIYI
jgi:hypothetical protein